LGGECILALVGGEDSEKADAGGFLVAEFLRIHREVYTKKG
jgi:hypothetical protein